ncbi:MAG: hypothetical protein ACFB4I_01225 [Cyanophyceae cyanobacterium]
MSTFSNSFRSHQAPVTKRQYQKFNLWLLGAVSAPIVSIGFFNFVVDPYDIFPTPELGINHAKPKKGNNDRVHKAVDVIRLRPTVVFVGSSRTKLGLDPSHAVWENAEEVYNLGLNGPNFYEQLRYLEHAIANQENLEAVVVGLDFFAFNQHLDNQPTFSEHRLEKQHLTIRDFVNFTASLDVLSASYATLQESLKTPKRDDYGQDGFTPDRYEGDPGWKFREGLKLYFQLHGNYELSEKYMDSLRTLVAICQQKEIPLYLFISPAHATQWEAIRATGRWQTFEQWKREVAAIAPVWDFSGYSSVTTEPVNSQSKNYTDNSHYTPLVGDLVLNRMFSVNEQSVPQDFGVLLTSENLESQLAQIRQNRQEWAKQNPEVVELVQKLQQEIKQE